MALPPGVLQSLQECGVQRHVTQLIHLLLALFDLRSLLLSALSTKHNWEWCDWSVTRNFAHVPMLLMHAEEMGAVHRLYTGGPVGLACNVRGKCLRFNYRCVSFAHLCPSVHYPATNTCNVMWVIEHFECLGLLSSAQLRPVSYHTLVSCCPP